MKIIPLILTISILAVCSQTLGQVVRSHDLDEHGFKLPVAQLTLTPSATSDDPFKYRLKVMPDERTAGNAAIVYSRAFTKYSYFKNDRLNFKEFKDAYSDWLGGSITLSEIPLEKLKIAASRFDEFVNEHIAVATRCEKCDWGYSTADLSGRKLYTLPMDEIRATHHISWTLVLQTRVAILERRFEDAAELLKMHYTLAQNMAKLPVNVATLTAISHFNRANTTLLEFCSAPGAPNMYWAISQLPQPLFSQDEAIEMQLSIFEKMIPEFASVEQTKMSGDQWKLLGQNVFRLLAKDQHFNGQDVSPPSEKEIMAQADAEFLTVSLKGITAAKKRLLAAGTSADELRSMPAAQIMLIDARREYVKDKAEFQKSIYLPVPELIKFDRKWNDEHRPMSLTLNMGQRLFDSYRPIHVKPKIAQEQSELDLIRVIEAIRMHATKTGTLPNELAELDSVSIPDNPVTVKPFTYQLKDGTGEFTLPTPSNHSHSTFILKLHSATDKTQRGSNE